MFATLLYPLSSLDSRWSRVPLMEYEDFLREWNASGLPLPASRDAISWNKGKTLKFLFEYDPEQVKNLLKSEGLDYSGRTVAETIRDLLAKDKTDKYHGIVFRTYLRFVPTVNARNLESRPVRLVRALDYYQRLKRQ